MYEHGMREKLAMDVSRRMKTNACDTWYGAFNRILKALVLPESHH